jgi:hypothetical protein
MSQSIRVAAMDVPRNLFCFTLLAASRAAAERVPPMAGQRKGYHAASSIAVPPDLSINGQKSGEKRP